MPSFDIVSEVNMHEVSNAIDQTNREVSTRFDFKGTDSGVELSDVIATIHSESEFQLDQILQILHAKMVKRNIDIGCLETGKPQGSGKSYQQSVTFRQGIESLLAKKIVKLIKDKKLKVQAAIQGEQIRVSGKKRDDLQQVIAMLKDQDFGLPLQYINFRD
ncbi:MAG: YajQ family cyclic di-GMP-binding protein [Gammaproteobacteria bacterium]|nr:YajQ family cyclic di-GMP-binding protein [Gammaproteobacteria bacterium]